MSALLAYPRPPITESVIELRFREPLDEKTVNKIANVSKKRLFFEEREDLNEFTFDVLKKTSGLKSAFHGWRLSSADRADVLMLRPSLLGIARLAPYLGWDHLLRQTQAAWEDLRRYAKPVLARVGARYINRIDTQDFDQIAEKRAILPHTVGVSREALALEKLRKLAFASSAPGPAAGDKSLAEQLYDNIFTSQVAVKLGPDHRASVFKQLDLLLDAEEWPESDLPPTLASYRTLLRIVLVLKPRRPPGLGTSSLGRLVAAWTTGPDRLTIECLPNDRLRWVVSVGTDDDRRTAAGESQLKHLVSELSPYGPERWFA
jgi:hypothetical protein